jgi:SAM-dependent methyltransferase
MTRTPRATHTETNAGKNSSFFGENLATYARNVQDLDTYARIRESIDAVIAGIDTLLDIGNGGVFDYDTSSVRKIVALDLFLDDLPDSWVCPPNVTLKMGSALEIPAEDESFDAALIVMLLHHLVGHSVGQCLSNIAQAVSEAYRVLRPGGKLIIVESCVPRWFYGFERLVFPVAVSIINALMKHPATIQYPPEVIAALIQEKTGCRPEVLEIPKGRWVLQYGFKVPSVLTPVQPFRFVVEKRR